MPPRTHPMAACTRLAAMFAWLGLLAGHPLASAQVCGIVQDLGTLPGGVPVMAHAVSADGALVVGGPRLPTTVSPALYWVDGGPLQYLGTLSGTTDAEARAVSADGGVIAGIGRDAQDDNVGFRWTQTTGMVGLGSGWGSDSYIWGMSSDGQVLVGYVFNGPAPMTAEPRAARWTTEFGWENLTPLGTIGSVASAANADGSVIVGQVRTASGNNLRAMRWTAATGWESLGTLGGSESFAYGVSGDGSIIVGGSQPVSGAERAFRWTAHTGMVSLGTLGGNSSRALGISADGQVIVGFASNAAGRARPFRWTAETGMTDLGVPVSHVGWATAANADGSVIVGWSGGSSQSARAFRWVRTPCPCDSIDVNNDGGFFDPQDIEAFLSVFSEGPCIPETATCGDIDFNNDGALFDPCDIDAFLLVFSEGPCTACGA